MQEINYYGKFKDLVMKGGLNKMEYQRITSNEMGWDSLEFNGKTYCARFSDFVIEHPPEHLERGIVGGVNTGPTVAYEVNRKGPIYESMLIETKDPKILKRFVSMDHVRKRLEKRAQLVIKDNLVID